ncbi:hypothetical protein PsexTeo8_60890 (plasmid) [Pseudomonas extremaustralis]|nr:hypothetical protein [Pseudomonas extremaustralis]
MAEKSEVVVKSNRLVEASYRLNLVEQQIILFAISRSRDEQLGLSPDKPVTIAASDFAQAFGTNETKVYGQLKEAMGDLFDRSVTIYDTDPETGKDRTVTTRWISDKAYIDGAGRIQLTFAPRVIPYITRLESEFTSYRLEKISGMSSVHAVRLYELLVQYFTIGKRELALANLRESLGLTNEYKAIKDFKKRVLDVAVVQINEHRGCKPETQKFPSADQHGLSRAWSMSSCIARMTSSWVYDLALGSSASRRASSTSRVIRAYSSGHSACSMRSDACPSRCSRPNSRMSLVATTCSRIRSWITSQARCASGVAVPS